MFKELQGSMDERADLSPNSLFLKFAGTEGQIKSDIERTRALILLLAGEAR